MLRWNQTQKGIYELISAGVPNGEIKAKGYNEEMIKKVKKAINKGDIPGKPLGGEKEPPPGKPLYSATLKTTSVTLDPIVAVRYDSVRHALELGDEYTLQQFIDEATDIITELVGAVPPGFVREEETAEVTAV
ncbi:hypothetical protein ES703_01213 [subsurface metagenome]